MSADTVDDKDGLLGENWDEWSAADSLAAQAEGWDIFGTGGSEGHDDFELQTIGAPSDWPDLDYDEPKFVTKNGEVDDVAAWRHVVSLATQGSLLHVRALAFLKSAAPDEYKRITTADPELIHCPHCGIDGVPVAHECIAN